ncbi:MULTISPECIES: PTS ascorbate transporter subunit IIC [unclassified Granulicatella]|uniref:PTS ascorbate transporter subunit IIC n=1 Tax=unclassified Granulicatella TaxID=2630493 RepID=UPI001074734B|nr:MULTISPECIES: PTS ascorbate transporter subunit IIC [unclassified Granulicatella]MBF0779890.1 PTS ascorbate transporter subunit IIC [Granulicatella sp. 19428wC4_WM01]TFU96094.1 PTS ascorbate transporter subunit IIC [Granulicatella sp. WM01]
MVEFLKDFFSSPAILLGLVALIGLLLQKKSCPDIIKGTIKTFVGFLVIGAGADVLVSALNPFAQMFQHGFNVSGVVPNNEAIVALALSKYGSATAFIMMAGMVFNILIARFTRFKYIFLTGHHTLYMACMVAVILSVSGLHDGLLVLIGGLALGIIMSLSPAILQPFMKDVTGNDNVALGHFSAVGYALSALVGKAVKGKKKVSTEEINFPKGLGFLRDSTVSITLTMAILYVIVAFAAGKDYIQSQLSDGQHFMVFALIKAGTFAAGVFVILAGVRLVLAEIVPAFKGISTKLVPNAKPALDCPIVFPFAPNAVIIGFFASFVGGLVSMLIMGAAGTIIVLPGVVPHFFTGATAGVYGNATGGVKGAILGSFTNGLVISFLPILLMPVLGDLGFAGSTFSDADFGVSGIFLGKLANLGGSGAVIIGVLAVLALMFAVSFKKKDSTK